MTQPIQGRPDRRYVRRLAELRLTDIPLVGRQNARLGELTTSTHRKGIPVPDGFATTAIAYRAFVEANNLRASIRAHLATWQRGEATLQQTGKAIRRLFLTAPFPPGIATAICQAYQQLSARSHTPDIDVTVRSSATEEDLSMVGVAIRQETVLHVSGERALLGACRTCYAALFSDCAIADRAGRGVDHLQVAPSIGVQTLVRCDLVGAGVIHTLDPETGFPCIVLITAARGPGEGVVQGTVQPDEYEVFTPVLRQGLCPIVAKRRGTKSGREMHSAGGGTPTRGVETSQQELPAFVLTDAEILRLARWAVTIEDHLDRPMAIDWAKDGRTGELFIVRARPEPAQARKAVNVGEIPETRTSIMLNIDDPGMAMRLWRLPCHGIGLVRMDSIISSVIGSHPPASARSDQRTDAAAGRQAQPLTRWYADQTKHIVEDLARGIATIAASQHPKPVIVRMSDVTANGGAILIGGARCELESMPDRCATARYGSMGFALECEAIKRAREQLGLENVIVMIPPCRTLEEANQVLAALADNGLRRGDHGLRIYATFGIPSNVHLAEEFAARFDGFSIESNGMTQPYNIRERRMTAWPTPPRAPMNRTARCGRNRSP